MITVFSTGKKISRNIAKKLHEYSPEMYEIVDIYKIVKDTGLFDNFDDYAAIEASLDENLLKKAINKYNHKSTQILAIVEAWNESSATVLKALQLVQKANIRVMVLRDTSDRIKKRESLHQQLVFAAVQEYARSSKFAEAILIDLNKLKKHLTGVPVIVYDEKLAESVAYTFNYVEYLLSQEPSYGEVVKREPYERITTYGIADSVDDEEPVIRWMEDIEMLSTMGIFFTLRKERQETDDKLFGILEDFVRKVKKEYGSICYEIHDSVSDERDYVYIRALTGNVKEIS